MAESRLFKPLKIGNIEVQHRIGMPSLTRLRADEHRIPTPWMKEYYAQRAAVPGTLIIAEGTVVSPAAGGGFPGAPGIWSKAQVAAWKEIVDEVHARGSFIFCQLFALGRAGQADVAEKEGVDIIGPSAVPIDGNSPVPRAMSIQDIKSMIDDFAQASRNAIEAGFDGVECHAANGYLLDQFTQDMSNLRDDEYGGSVENRSRFAHGVMKAMVDAVGAERVGLRLSPWSPFQGIGMVDPIPQFSDIIIKASKLKLAYLHLVESRIAGASDRVGGNESLDFAYHLWDGPLLIAGGYKTANAKQLVDEEHPDKEIVVMFGRYFISNPDLVFRAKEGVEFSAYDRSTFYFSDPITVGYSDYPLSVEFVKSQNVPVTSVA